MNLPGVMWDGLMSRLRPRTRFNAGVAALVLLALLSGALTVRAANGDALAASHGVVDGAPSSLALADPVDAPASLTVPRVPGSMSLVPGSAERVVASSSTNAIPSAALSAYQRAETVINAADRTCRLTWQLIAAIGRVESDHGRFGGSVLSTVGLAGHLRRRARWSRRGRPHLRHRRRTVRPRRHLRPRGRAAAVHPIHVGCRWG